MIDHLNEHLLPRLPAFDATSSDTYRSTEMLPSVLAIIDRSGGLTDLTERDMVHGMNDMGADQQPGCQLGIPIR